LKTPLPEGEALIRSVLLDNWGLQASRLSFIPVGDTAYSYKIEAQSTPYYLKLVDQRTDVGRRTAAQMEFSLPFQRLVAQQNLPGVSAPLPQLTTRETLYAVRGPLLCALYTFIEGETLADAYPMPVSLITRIGQALGTLHTVRLPDALRQRAPRDSLTAAFDGDLLADLASLEHISRKDPLYLQRLREIVWPRREEVRAFLARGQEYARDAQLESAPTMACHGDPWGGNLIPAADGRLVFLDWEASVIAPAERDAFTYIRYVSGDFAAFDAGYRLARGTQRWNAPLLAYYAHRLQMRNLAHWLHNLLHEQLDEEQRENDLEMLGFHCLDRLASVEQSSAKLSI
jgi:spectinomycin phosphotransferase